MRRFGQMRVKALCRQIEEIKAELMFVRPAGIRCGDCQLVAQYRSGVQQNLTRYCQKHCNIECLPWLDFLQNKDQDAVSSRARTFPGVAGYPLADSRN